MQVVDFKDVGAPSTPQEVRRMRRQVMDQARFLGQPICAKHMFGIEDVESGLAKKCPACYNQEYGQVRGDCPVCFGIGYVSVANNTSNLYISTSGAITTNNSSGVLAPLYGGFAQSFLTWIVEPDVATDIFKLTPGGALVRTQNAQGFAPWSPTLYDNDLIINVTLAKDNRTITSTNERYQLKQVQPSTLRGWGRRTIDHEFLVGQSFEMAQLFKNTIYFSVPV